MKQHANIFKDLAIVLISVIVAVILVKTNALEGILTSTKEMKIISSFVAGLFFTSIFTVAPATVALGEIAQTNSIFLVAIIGGLGALIGDYIIFRFIKDNLSEDIVYFLKQSRQSRLASIFRLKFFRGLTILLGAIIIASPLPDELGLAMLGLSKVKNSLFIPISFTLNSLGILAIGLIAKTVS